jgi:hypothetical protein
LPYQDPVGALLAAPAEAPPRPICARQASRNIFFRQSSHSRIQQNKSAASEYNSEALAAFAPNDIKRA